MLANFLCLLLVAPPAPAGLDGSWVVVDDGGENPVRPSGHVKGTRWTFDNGSLEFSTDREDGPGRFYDLGVKGGVKTIELTLTPKRVWSGTPLIGERGVYAIDGDRLRIYLAPLWLEKPKVFPKPGGEAQCRVLVLERAKK